MSWAGVPGTATPGTSARCWGAFPGTHDDDDDDDNDADDDNDLQERQWPHRLRRHRAHGVESHGQGEYLTSELNDYGSKIGVFSRKCSHSF